MKAPATLSKAALGAGLGALLVAVLGFGLGAVQLGMTAAITALMCTAAGLAWFSEHGRRMADLSRRTYQPE